jgi:hypothetical protein
MTNLPAIACPRFYSRESASLLLVEKQSTHLAQTH